MRRIDSEAFTAEVGFWAAARLQRLLTPKSEDGRLHRAGLRVPDHARSQGTRPGSTDQEDSMHSMNRASKVAGVAWACALLAFVALAAGPAAEAGTIQSVCSGSGLSQIPLAPFATDPPRPDPSRCIPGPGSVSSSVSSCCPPGFGPGAFFWEARSSISVDPAAGMRFSGFAQVSFNDVPPDIGLAHVAGTAGSFRDVVTISPPPGYSGPPSAVLLIPLHVTGSASTAGTDGPTLSDPRAIQHTAEMTYHFKALGTSSFGFSDGTVGLSTTGETLVCGPAACGDSPVPFDDTRIVKLPFTFGEEFLLDGTLTVDASFGLFGPPGVFLGGHSISDFSHTVLFGPATVVDASGHVISGVTIDSGLDYLAGSLVSAPPTPTPGPGPVPQPTSAMLLASGLIVADAARRLRRRS